MTSARGIRLIPCSLCGSSESRLVFSLPVRPQHAGKFNRDAWDIVRCQECGLMYENPQPDSEALDYFYTFDNPEDFRFVQDWFISSADLNRSTWRRILKAMRSYQSPGRLLDVGCGAGSFLQEAARAGYQACGQDIAPFFVEHCRKEGLEVHQGQLETLALPPESFDCVTAFDVIEHHPDPKRLLEQMASLVRPGGLIVVGTHDAGNIFARLYGPRWRHMIPVGHLTYFTRQTLGKMVASAGLRVLRSAGANTVDGSRASEAAHAVEAFLRLVVLRSFVLGLYRPLASIAPALTRWRFHWGGTVIDHEKLMLRAGTQVIMNDNMVVFAVKDRQRAG